MHPKMNVAIKAARQAGRMILKASENLSSIEVHEKAKNNYVTNVDLEVEKHILSVLQKAFPDQYYITEESGSFGNEESDHTWIIDPIDGTNNFIHGLPHHCVSIAMQFRGKTDLAVIYNPYLDQLFTATKGSGAQLNGQRIRVAKRKEFSSSLFSGALKYSSKVFKESYPQAILELYKEISGLRYSGSLALDMCYVAAGYLDAVWTSRDAKIWDTAGAALMIKEAGGMLCGLDGGLNFLEDGRLIGGNPKIVAKLTTYLAPHIQ
ncbi:inositol monophosphatase family protein [Fangia hongkongensis]|nr:inositol monophosphatase family protein [Fangia hongkongensis]MBK2124059.1 inositol monophosphatase [Fangia hongkongensis]